jgi:hypothetical protein
MRPLPDWDFWKHKTVVTLLEGAFLSCGIDPDSQSYRDILSFGLDNEEVEKRLRLLKDNLCLPQFFSPAILNIGDSNLTGVSLPEFAAWCAHIGFDVPPELAALANAVPQATPAAKVEAAPVEQAAPDAKVKIGDVPTSNWKLKIQAEAARRWKELVTMGCSPTRNSIKDDLATWCRNNEVATDGGIFPRADYIYKHVIRAAIWKPPTN